MGFLTASKNRKNTKPLSAPGRTRRQNADNRIFIYKKKSSHRLFYPLNMKPQKVKKAPDFSFQKRDRLLKKTDFAATEKFGRKFHSFCFVARTIKSGAPGSRLGLTVSKRVGRAVNRNRVKRLAREYFRLNRHRLAESRDINIIAKKTAADVSSRQIRLSLEEIFDKICSARSH